MLDGRDEPLAVADLAVEIAARERDVPVDAAPDEAVERVFLTLYHDHVPRMDEAGAVEHDRERNVVAISPLGERLAATLRSDA